MDQSKASMAQRIARGAAVSVVRTDERVGFCCQNHNCRRHGAPETPAISRSAAISETVSTPAPLSRRLQRSLLQEHGHGLPCLQGLDREGPRRAATLGRIRGVLSLDPRDPTG